MPLEMVNCGNCRRCWTSSSVKPHGPYEYVYVTRGGSKHHLYGAGVGSPAMPDATLSGEEVERLRRELEDEMRTAAEREYQERRKRLSPEQGAKIDEQMGLQNRLKRKRREQKRAVKKRTHEGMTAAAVRRVREEVEAQFVHEIAELKKQIKEGRAELQKMLRAESSEDPKAT